MTAQKFITFEGGEGSGKSTQARMLAERLQALGHEVVVTREPGGSPVAEKIRALILADKPVEPVAEFLLFAAARAEHIAATIGPALARGAYVICDRYMDSTRVYQGDLGAVDKALISTIEQATVAPYFPALTLVLDVPPQAGLTRTAARGNLSRYDAQDEAYHQALRAGFLAIAKREPTRCTVIDGSRDPGTVAADVWRAVEARLLAKDC